MANKKKNKKNDSGAAEAAAGCCGLVIFGLVGLALLGSCDAIPEPKSHPKPSHTATHSPSPSRKPSKTAEKLPSQVGKGLDDAQDAAETAGLTVEPYDASGLDNDPTDFPGDWKVCFHKQTGVTARFGAVYKGATCPHKPRTSSPKMPSVKGKSLADARHILHGKGFPDSYIDESTAYTDEESDPVGEWTVCSQDVKSGDDLDLEPIVGLDVVRPGDTCPSGDGVHYRNPANDPFNSGGGSSSGGGDSSDGGSTSGGSTGGDHYNPGGCPPGGCDNSRHCPPGGCTS
ncbi:PASTA domain-containing protein [Streptomyces sp. NPDC048483]|uniref:Stk1 family PASTA domain-containing Ser/Thr kinase n=1 Tax=Streptomyces sp. NPDC048483 TaxID=3154927 RepID=UPI0034442F91